MTPVAASTFGFLTLAIFCLWIPPGIRLRGVRPWQVSFGATLIFAWFGDIVTWPAIPALLLLMATIRQMEGDVTNPRVKAASIAVFIPLAAAMAFHVLPGFHNPVVINREVISPDAIPYALHLNLDKALVGVLLLGFGTYLHGRKMQLLESFGLTAAVAGGTAAALLPLSHILGYVRFEPKIDPNIAIWAYSNLFITCLSEEAIFRGFIQTRLSRALECLRGGRTLALLIAAFSFGLAHYGGGPLYVLLAAVAGIGYGLSYSLTGRLEAAILTHFSVNLLHFLFFTYPALKSAIH